MATEDTNTIKTSGGDYTSLSGWESGEQANIVTGDIIAIAECYTMEDTSAFTIDGWTTDATRYIKIYTPSAERHDGKWNTSKYRLVDTVNFNYTILIVEDYVRIEGIQVYNESVSSGGGLVYSGAGEFRLSHSIIRADSTTARPLMMLSTAGGSATVKIWNNIMYDCYRGIYHSFGNSGNTYVFYNNTLHGMADTGIEIQDSAGDVSLYLKNNIIQSTTDDNYVISSFTTYENADNVSEDATSPNAPHRNDAVTFENEGADDFHLGSGDTNAKDLGTDLSSDSDGQLSFSDDIDGDTRSGTWDIGADEYVAAGGISIPVVMHHLKQQGIS
jgi:hypothetical protein